MRWPIIIDQTDKGLYAAQWELDRIETLEFHNPVVQVQEDWTEDVVYTLRINGNFFTPRVRNPGTYTVLAFDPDGFYRKTWNQVKARKIDTTAE